MLELFGIIITLICVAVSGGIITLAIAGQKGMIKDEYMDYIFDMEEEEPLK